MAKEPRDRFGSMDELCAELTACLESETAVSGAQTMVVSRRQRRASRPPAGRPSVWPLILLLAGLAVLAGILAAVFAFTDPGSQLSDLVGKKKKTVAATGPVHFTTATAYDPFGDNSEHDPQARQAIDGNPTTFWNTEHYNGGLGSKPGVGLVVGMGAAKKLSELVVRSDTPGFTAKIESGSRATGPFKSISGSKVVGGNTTFTLTGDAAQYYVVWITDLGSNSSVEVNEVKGS